LTIEIIDPKYYAGVYQCGFARGSGATTTTLERLREASHLVVAASKGEPEHGTPRLSHDDDPVVGTCRLNAADQAPAPRLPTAVADEREISRLIARLQLTQKQLDSVLATVDEERCRREQQVNRAEAQVAQLRARLAERDRDLSGALASGHRAAQELAVARRNFELANRTLRVMFQLGEIATCTSPVGAPSSTASPRRGISAALNRIRHVAKGRTSFFAVERLRRAVEKSGVFDAAWYRHQRPDLPDKQDLLDHFIFYGIEEGTSPNPLIDVDWIAKSVGKSRDLALRMYLLHGRHTDLGATPLFDVTYYRASAGLGTGTDALSHYLRRGYSAGLSPHSLFDRAFYSSQLPKFEHRTFDAFVHYVHCPFELDPHPLFSTEYYLSQHPELPTLGICPLLHYLEYGCHEKTNPHASFSGRAYLDRYNDVAARGLNPLLHYVTFGKSEGRQIDPVSR